jgi:ATP-binding cassette, subfamily B, bacterial
VPTAGQQVSSRGALRSRARRIADRARERRPVLELLRLLPRADPWGTVGLILQILATGLLPVAFILISGALVGAASGGSAILPGIHNAWTALGVMTAISLVSRLGLPFLTPLVDRLAYRVELLLRERMLQAVLLPPTIAHLEDPGLADELAQARAVATEPVQITQVIGMLSSIASSRLTIIGSVLMLAEWRWWAPVVIGGAWIFSNTWHRKETGQLISSLEGSATGFRRARYLGDLALGGAAAKELRVFGLGPWLAGRFEAQWREGMGEAWAGRDSARWMLLVSGGCLVAAHGLIFGLLAVSAVHGGVELGSLIIYVQAVMGLGGLGWNADSQYTLRLGIAPVPHILRLSAAAESPELRLPGSGTPPPPQAGIRFEGVSFAYPGTGHAVLRDLDLWLPAERSLAIVGENGSGKTTLLKLLCRFYDPTDGRLTVDGTDLREFDAAGWQRRVAAVFQDFGRYPLSAYDNVAFGNLAGRDDEQALGRAAADAGIEAMIQKLPAGWDTPLSRQFPGGIDPSGGQWQRLALARVLFAVNGGARVLILDEPTASLDIRAEAAFYDHFLELTRGLTTVIVSHRFSTVRRADHIVVLDGGQVVEAGSHAELMALGGRYAAMFELQAAAYREASHA